MYSLFSYMVELLFLLNVSDETPVNERTDVFQVHTTILLSFLRIHT